MVLLASGWDSAATAWCGDFLREILAEGGGSASTEENKEEIEGDRTVIGADFNYGFPEVKGWASFEILACGGTTSAEETVASAAEEEGAAREDIVLGEVVQCGYARDCCQSRSGSLIVFVAAGRLFLDVCSLSLISCLVASNLHYYY